MCGLRRILMATIGVTERAGRSDAQRFGRIARIEHEARSVSPTSNAAAAGIYRGFHGVVDFDRSLHRVHSSVNDVRGGNSRAAVRNLFAGRSENRQGDE